MTEHVGRFMKTLHKIYIYIEAQQDRNKFKQLFRNIEMSKVVKDCHADLDEAKNIFKIGTGGAVFKDIAEMKKATETKHKELLELISTMSETTTTEGSSVHLGANELKNSSTSFSLLPSKPKIFHGREAEVDIIMKMLGQQSPRIAILGGGGMGKTSLARAILHKPETSAKFEEKYFVSTEAATTSIELAALIGLHIGLNPGKDLTKLVIQFFSRKPSCLLILDNLETVWESFQSRGEVEEFLSLLTDIQHLGLIITMRGAERPAKVQWTHPFLSPLQPLSNAAAQQTFLDITDNTYAIEDLNQLLGFTDNMPLAVDLISHLVDYEGLENVLSRWQTDKTSILSVGYDRRSNLDASISLSISSPRLSSESKELLSLLSILPNGLSDAELVQSKLPIPKILSCKAVLLATSLAYEDSNKRLLVLVPVREHIQQFLSPPPLLIHSLCKHFHALLKLYEKYDGEQLNQVVSQITMNLGNLQEVLQRGLSITSNSNLEHTIHCVTSLNSFYRITGRGAFSLMDQIEHILSQMPDLQLKIHFLVEALRSRWYYNQTQWIEESIVQGISHFKQVTDPVLECKYPLFLSHSLSYCGTRQILYWSFNIFLLSIRFTSCSPICL
ncbi:P-loop containing nucleoside triphosphate hydrolase protein [Mycena sanguinolenta]|nr:P-loop containing nucleoside triphosphate hydrolase protein [Mycena sanguinolenta]